MTSSAATLIMPKPVNTPLRIFVPLVAALLGIGVAWSVWKVGQPQPAAGTTPPTTVAAQPSVPEVKPAEAVSPPASPTVSETSKPENPPNATPAAPTAAAPATPPPPLQPAGPAEVLTKLSAQSFAGDPEATFDGTLGGTDKKGPEKAKLSFSAMGAGLASVELADYFVTIKEEQNLPLQTEHRSSQGDSVLTPMAALAIEVIQPGESGQPARSSQFVGLTGAAGAPVWRRISATAGAFEAFVIDAAGEKVLRITRQYSLASGSRDVYLNQSIENLSGSPLTVRWYQVGAVDPPGDSGTYGGDKRFIRFGYLLSAERDPTRAAVLSGTYDHARSSIIGERVLQTASDGSTFTAFKDWNIWPTPAILENKIEPAWLAFTNRYFGVAIHPIFDPNQVGGRTLGWLGGVDRVVLDGGAGFETIGLRLSSMPMSLAAAGSGAARVDLSHGIYVGPLEKKQINAEPLLRALKLDRMVVYNFGGPCGFCTFDWMTSFLLSILRTLHDLVFHDWALSIVFLVVIVRTCLHPLTRWTQIRMGVFGKQMSGIGPKQKLIQERFKDDPTKMQQETAKLWREEGISPAGFLGCLPAFAQTPVWIALSAVLFFSVELRHQAAFYGVFQNVQPQNWLTWWFLGDLAEPDAIIQFGHAIVTIPILGPITSINLLPLLLGIVFFIQQKYMQPPTSTQMTPEQETQAKMMKWMTVFMFPVMMYNAPAGLALYFTVNSTLAIFESKWIRAHMEKHGMLDLDKIRAMREAKRQGKGPQKSGGFMAALQAYAEKKQNETKRSFGQDKPAGRKGPKG